VLTLRGQDRLVPVDRLALHLEDHVREGGVVDDLAHVQDQRVDRLVVDFVLFKFADVEDADIIQPFATIEAAEDEKLFHTDHARGVTLTTGGSLLALDWMAPSHCVGVKNVEIVAGNDLFE